MNIIKDINPDQSRNRRAGKVERRIYTSQGSNAVWNADGYDKLKPYGFPIHGTLMGFRERFCGYVIAAVIMILSSQLIFS